MTLTGERCQQALDNLYTQERFMNAYAYEVILFFFRIR